MRRMILIEGLDLAGKSTLTASLEQYYRELGVPTRLCNGQFCADNPTAAVARELVRWDEGFSGVEAGSIFLSSMLWDQRHYEPFDGVHIQDSSWLRTLAFEQLYGSPLLAKMMEEQGRKFPRFGGAVMLTASIPERKRRLAQRGQNDLHDLMAFQKPEKFLAIETRLAELVQKWENGSLISTDGRSPDEVLERVLSVVERRLAS